MLISRKRIKSCQQYLRRGEECDTGGGEEEEEEEEEGCNKI